MTEEGEDKEIDRSIIYEALELQGLSKDAADAYVHLHLNGPQHLDDIPINAHKRMKSIQALISKRFVTVARNGQYSARDPELTLREKIQSSEQGIKIMQKATEELILSGHASNTLPLNTGEEFYRWEGQLFERAHDKVDSLTVRFKLAWLMKDIISRRRKEGIKFRVLGCISTPETRQRALDLHEAGAEVRHTDAVEEMLRFILIDGTSVLFGFRDPSDPAVHVGAWMRSESFTQPLDHQFETVWKRSKPYADWIEIDV